MEIWVVVVVRCLIHLTMSKIMEYVKNNNTNIKLQNSLAKNVQAYLAFLDTALLQDVSN
jgi:hypothetical protein